MAASADGGRTWRTVFRRADTSGYGVSAVGALAVGPRDGGHVIAAGPLYHGGLGVETRDGGASWRNLPTSAASLASPTLVLFDPATPAGMSPSVWETWGVQGYVPPVVRAHCRLGARPPRRSRRRPHPGRCPRRGG